MLKVKEENKGNETRDNSSEYYWLYNLYYYYYTSNESSKLKLEIIEQSRDSYSLLN